MTRKEFLKKYMVKFSAALLLVGLIVYTVYHIRGASAADLMTVPAREITDLRLMSGNAYLFREESVLLSDGVGVVNNLVQSGAKVGKNEELSQVWTGYTPLEQVRVQAELEQLDRVIAVLEKSALSGNTTLSQAEEIRQEAKELHLSLQQAIFEGRWETLADTSDEMLALLNRHGILTGKAQDYKQQLEDLKAEKNNLLKGSCITVQNTDSSGFFYDRYCVDGYETLYTMERLNALTPADLDTLKNALPQSAENTTTVGKMVYGYSWYLAVELSGDTSVFLPQTSYEVRFPQTGGKSLTMVCEWIVEGEDGRFLAILCSNDDPAWFSYQRIQTVEIVVGSSVGYYVPESALVELNGVEGVYIFRDSTVRFKRIEVLYRGEGYCIAAAQGDRGDDYLGLYDILITSGKNLYDGKVY